MKPGFLSSSMYPKKKKNHPFKNESYTKIKINMTYTHIIIYIYKTEVFETLTVFHVSIYLSIYLFYFLNFDFFLVFYATDSL